MRIAHDVIVVFVIWISIATAIAAEVRSRQKRVIGGDIIATGEWPWLVHLKGKIPTLKVFGIPILYQNYYCGASLINDRWLLTAAHCFTVNDAPRDIFTPRYWHAKLGNVDSTHTFADRFKSLLSDVVDEPEWKLWHYHAEKIILHPLYDASDDWKHDIALIKLDADLPLNDPGLEHLIRPVTLPTDQSRRFQYEWPAPGALCVIKGWGCTQNGGSVTNVARSTILPIKPRNECVFEYISETRLCAGFNNANSGICPGDSGSPLVCGYRDRGRTIWVQAGIASFTSADRPDSVPGVFTRVEEYTDWIWHTINYN